MKAKQLVMQTLANNAAARNSDRLLMLAVWRTQGLELSPEQERLFMQVTSPETIRRERQKIQADGLYSSNEQVRKARKELEIEHKKEATHDKSTLELLKWINE